MQKIPKYRSLSGKLLFIVLLSSSVMTTLLTGFTLYIDYRMEIQDQKSDLALVQNSIIRSIERSLWILDRTQTRAQIEGIMTIPSVFAVRITDPYGEALFENRKDLYPNSAFEDTYPLKYQSATGEVLLGHLTLKYTRDFIYAKLKTKIFSVFAAQAIKTFIISFFLFWVFTHLLTRHLSELVQFLSDNKNLGSSQTPKLRFFRSKVFEERSLQEMNQTLDEFDLVQKAINDAVVESQSKVKEIELLKEVAQQSSRAKGMLIKNISHDMRTPLNTLLGSLELLKEQMSAGEEAKMIFQLQHKSIHFLSHMINDLLDLAKLEANELLLEENKIDSKEFFYDIQQQAKVFCAESGGLLSMTVDSQIPKFIVTDRTRLKQILINIIHYCVRRTEQGTTFLNIYYGADKKLRVNISDSGHYLTEEHVPYVFEPFSLVSEGPMGGHKPSALGLSVAKRLIEFFNGQIIFTRTLSGGSLFTLTIPIQEPAKEQVTPYVYRDGDVLKKAHILLIEDTIENQMLMKAYFKKTPYTTSIANNGIEGVDQFKKNKFDLIIMDLDMPIMNGYEATEQIREFEKSLHLRPTHIVAVSAFTGKSDVEKAFKSGVDSYISKPISRAQIIEYIEIHLRKSTQTVVHKNTEASTQTPLVNSEIQPL